MGRKREDTEYGPCNKRTGQRRENRNEREEIEKRGRVLEQMSECTSTLEHTAKEREGER